MLDLEVHIKGCYTKWMKMVAVASQPIGLSPSKPRDESASCINNSQFYYQLKSEVQVLQNEVKSVTEIINVLSKELEMASVNNEVSKTHMCSVVKDKRCETSCSKCALLDMKLQEAVTEISSLKLVIDLLKNDRNFCTQPHQEKQNVGNILANTDNDILGDKNFPSEYKKVSFPKEAANRIQHAVPTSNRYAALSMFSGHQYAESLSASYSTQTARDSLRGHISSSTTPQWKKPSPRASGKRQYARFVHQHSLVDQESACLVHQHNLENQESTVKCKLFLR